MSLPTCDCLALNLEQGILHLHFNRPKARNALSLKMVEELEAVLEAVADDRSVRAIFLRGAGGHFCAGGDIKDMAMARGGKQEADGMDPIAVLNRRFGHVISQLNRAPQTVVAIVEGAAMGGGFGLVCVADVVIAMDTAKLRLPETGLGLPPAQIAPFLVQRLGLATARRLALTGARLTGEQAKEEGLADIVCTDAEGLEGAISTLASQIRKCAPKASATTKALLLDTAHVPLSELLDRGACEFAAAARSVEGMEGVMAFIQKRKPKWETA